MDWHASAHFIPAADLSRLCEAAEQAAPGEPHDGYDRFLDELTIRRADFAHSGEFVAVALSYLDEKRVDVHAAHQEKAERLCARREATHVIFTQGLARAVLPRLSSTPIGVQALVRYDARLRGAPAVLDAAPLKDAVRFVRDVLKDVGAGEKAVLVIRLRAPARAARPALEFGGARR